MTDSEEKSRRLLDDDGRLFGLVNVVDALVVLLVLAIAVAGVMLLVPGSSGDAETRYVTLDLNDQPDYVAEEISAGDEWSPDGTDNSLTVTDVYRFNSADNGTGVLARAELNGTLFEPDDPTEDPTFEFLGNPLRIGQTFDVVTSEYEVQADVTRVERSGETLPVNESEFVLEASLEPATTSEIEVGDEFTAGGDVFGEVTTIETFPGESENSTERYALVGISASTIAQGGSEYVGDSRVAVGEALAFSGDGYDISGAVLERGTSEVTTEPQELVVQTEVPTATADAVQAGDEYTIDGVPIVTVESVTVYPTADADVRRVVLGVSAKTRVDNDAVLFGGQQLRTGSQLPIETGEYDLAGEVIRRGSLDEPGTQTTQTVTMQLDNVSAERAEGIEAGMTEQTRDGTTAQVRNVSTEPAEVVLKSEDGDIFLREHPRNRDVELTVELSVRELDDGTLRFRGETLRAGQTVALELGPITVEGEVLDFRE